MDTRLSKLETEMINLKAQLIEFSRRNERDIDDLKKTDNARHQDNLRKLEELDAGQRIIEKSISEVTGGVVVVRNIMHMFWLLFGAAIASGVQYFVFHH